MPFLQELRKHFGSVAGIFYLLISFLIPFGFFYGIFNFSGITVRNQIESMTTKKYKVAWIADNGQAGELRDRLELNLRLQLVDNLKESDLKTAVLKDSISVGIIISENFDSSISQQKKAGIKLFYEGQSRGLAMVEKTIAGYRKSIIQKNSENLNLPEGALNPLEIAEYDYTDTQAMIDNAIKMLYNAVSILTILLLLIFGTIGTGFSLRKIELSSQEIKLFPKIANGTFFTFTMMILSLFGLYFALIIKQEGIFETIMIQLRNVLTFDKLMLLILTSLPLGLFLYGVRALFFAFFKKTVAVYSSNLVLVVLICLTLYFGSSSDTLNYYNILLPYVNNVYAIKSILSDKYSVMLLLANVMTTTATAFLLLFLSQSGLKK